MEQENLNSEKLPQPIPLKKEIQQPPFFNEISDPIIVIDDNCIIKKANPSANNIFNINEETYTQTYNLLNFVNDENKRNQIVSSLKQVKTDKEVIEKVRFASTSNSLLNADLHISKKNSNISSDDQFTILLKKDDEADKLEKLNELKSEFLAQMSHEIRTPLSTMLNFTNLIHEEVKDKVSEELDESFEHINVAGKRIIRTIDLLLNLSEIHSGTYDYIPSNFDLLDDVVMRLYKEYKIIANKKGLKFFLNVDENNYLIYGDHFKIEEIFKHLVENAIHFTKTGSIRIKISSNNNNRIFVKIIDTGVGISDSYLPMIYEPFSQEEHGYSRSYDGNGIGLALVKRYCELNKIELQVSSKKNIGTCFKLLFN